MSKWTITKIHRQYENCPINCMYTSQKNYVFFTVYEVLASSLLLYFLTTLYQKGSHHLLVANNAYKFQSISVKECTK